MAGLAPDAATIHLGRMSPPASCNPPGRLIRKPIVIPERMTRRPYSVLLPVGFTVPPVLPPARWALTPPFHPYPVIPDAFTSDKRRGGLLSVALSLGSPPPGVTRHRVSMEPGLSSPAAFRHMTGAAARPTDRAYKFVSRTKSNKKADSKSAAGSSFTSNGLKRDATAHVNLEENLKMSAYRPEPSCNILPRSGSCGLHRDRHYI